MAILTFERIVVSPMVRVSRTVVIGDVTRGAGRRRPRVDAVLMAIRAGRQEMPALEDEVRMSELGARPGPAGMAKAAIRGEAGGRVVRILRSPVIILVAGITRRREGLE